MKSHGNFTYLDTEYLLEHAFAAFSPQVVAKPNEVVVARRCQKGGAFPLGSRDNGWLWKCRFEPDEIGHLVKESSHDDRLRRRSNAGRLLEKVSYLGKWSSGRANPTFRARRCSTKPTFEQSDSWFKWPLVAFNVEWKVGGVWAGFSVSGAILLIWRRVRLNESAPLET